MLHAHLEIDKDEWRIQKRHQMPSAYYIGPTVILILDSVVVVAVVMALVKYSIPLS